MTITASPCSLLTTDPSGPAGGHASIGHEANSYQATQAAGPNARRAAHRWTSHQPQPGQQRNERTPPDNLMLALTRRSRGRLEDLIGSAQLPGPPAPAPSAARARRWSAPAASPHRSRPGGPSGAASRARCRTWPRSSRSLPLRGMLVLVLEHHADGPLPQLLGIPAWSCHGSNRSRVGAPRNPGAVQAWTDPAWCVAPHMPWSHGDEVNAVLDR
jgi:hypothetical protein